MPVSQCPGSSLLRAVVTGGADDSDLRDVEEHVLICQSCFETLKQFTHESKDLWPQPGPATGSADDRELMFRLESMRPADATLPPDRTPGDPQRAGDFQPPTMIGPFRIGELLGSGGVGLVYAAEDTELLRPVAVKILRPEHAGNPISRQRFLDEARAAASIVNDHIVPIYRVGEDAALPYIAMPRLPGQSLAAKLSEQGKLTVDEAIDIARQVADGLVAAHERGLIHRDIKPANLWLEPTGRVRILDFGLARFLASDARLTQTGLIIGTPAYMAPEQADGDNVDHRCDLFGLGCVLYQMIAGRVPFPGATPFAVFKAMAQTEPPPLTKIEPSVPVRLAALVSRLLEREPDKRPDSAQEVVRELREAHQPLQRIGWHRRRLLKLLGAAAAGLTGASAWWWASRPSYLRQLYLPPGAFASVRHGLIEPDMTGTIECWLTALGQFAQSTPLLGNDLLMILGEHGPNGTNSYELRAKLSKPPNLPKLPINDHFGGGAVDVGRRVHLAAVNTGVDFRLFIDGQFIASKIMQPYLALAPAAAFSLSAADSAVGMRFDAVRVSSIPRYLSTFEPTERHEPDEHTLALYRCDDMRGSVLSDSSGNGRHGTLRGPCEWVQTPRSSDVATSPPADAPPAIDDFALVLRADNEIYVPQVLFPDSGPMTMEATVSLTERSNRPVPVLGPKGRLTVYVALEGWAITAYTDLDRHHLMCHEPIELGRRYHLAFTFDMGIGRWFVDGRLIETHDFGKKARMQKRPEPIYIGGGMVGTIDEIRISDTVRYTENFTTPARHQPDGNTLLLFHCDEGSGELLRDTSPNHHSTTIKGFQWVLVKKRPPQKDRPTPERS